MRTVCDILPMFRVKIVRIRGLQNLHKKALKFLEDKYG